VNYFKTAYYLVLGFLSVIAVLLVISIFPITGNIRFMMVLSGSMEPAIKTGSIVEIKSAQSYKIGDVITFGPDTKKKSPITHRIYDIKVEGGEPVYVTKGDANNAADQNGVLKKDVIGKVLISVPFVGYAVDFAKKPLGFALIVIIPVALIIIEEIRKIYNEVKKKEKP
jgi:signal peptidase